ncbi:response regulator [candidate division KSB1 bacterium]|nr:response regulator [candidate division KSB1 bacterium]
MEGILEQQIHILILEDVSTDAKLIELELKNAKLPILTKQVTNKEQFVKALDEFNPDLILSDYSLPEFTGMSAIEMAQERDKHIPLIVVTGAIDEETAVDCMKAGAVDYVLKDHLGRLVPAVKSALEKRKATQERIKAETALVESETRYRRLFESAREGILIVDGDSKQITDANPFMLKLLNEGIENIKEQTLWEIGLSLDKETVQQALKDFKLDDYVHWDDITLETRNENKIHVEVSYNECLMDGKRVGQCNIRDISGRKEAEEEREVMREQLFQSQKMEAIGALAGGVAHDFNNMMTAIQVSADVAMMKIDENETVFMDFKEIRQAALRAAGLIRQLLLFSRKHPMEFTLINVNTVIENLISMLYRLIGEDISIETDFEDSLWTARADIGNIEQVIMNLTLNARDAMPDGGRLMIQTKNINIDAELCKTMPEGREGKFLCLSIGDTGIGMSDEIVQRIFEPFYTTKDAGKGTGLGLAVVYGIVSQHNGWIHINSTPMKGSTFQVFLPGIEDHPDEWVEPKEQIDLLRGDGEKILIVEDEEKVREFTSRALQRCGYTVLVCKSAEEALVAFKREKQDIDLVFSDVVLCDRNGIEMIEEMLVQKADLNVLLSSGYMDQKSQWPIIRERGFPFLQKPYALSGLLQATHDAIHSVSSTKK